MAGEVTLTMADFQATEFSAEGVSVVTAKNSGTTEPVYNATGKDLRVYAKGSITLSSAQNITGISFVISTQGKKRLAPLTASVGEIAVAGDPDFTAVWSGSATEVTITVGEKADYGTDGSAKAGQLDFTAIEVTLDGEAPVTMAYYVCGSMTEWGPRAAYKLVANPEAEGEFMGEFTFAANDEFKVVWSDGATVTDDHWFPSGMENNYKITEAGDYTVYFRPDGQGGSDWHYGYFIAIKKEVPADPTNCAEAAAAALSVADDGKEEFNGGQVYTIEGYVTGIKTEWSSQYKNISFWMADEKDGGEVIQAFRAVCENEADAPKIGDKVKVSGKLINFHGTPEFAAGCTFEITIHQGIEETVAEGKTVKVVREGKLVILKGDHEYTPMGQIVK